MSRADPGPASEGLSALPRCSPALRHGAALVIHVWYRLGFVVGSELDDLQAIPRACLASPLRSGLCVALGAGERFLLGCNSSGRHPDSFVCRLWAVAGLRQREGGGKTQNDGSSTPARLGLCQDDNVAAQRGEQWCKETWWT